MIELEEKVSELEKALTKLTYMQMNTQSQIENLSVEMKIFKDEMRSEMKEFREEMQMDRENFKAEMRDFKDEMRTDRENFKAEMRSSRENFSKKILNFKDESRREMTEFKKEMSNLKRDLNKRLGEIANKYGTLAEDIVAPNIPGVVKRYFGCGELDDFMVRRKKRHTKDRSKRRKFDVIAVCEDYVFLNETKGNSQMGYIKKFIEFVKSGEFFDYFPEYNDMKLIPIFSTLYLDESHITFLSRNGIYAMALGEEMMNILNYNEIEKDE